MAVLRGVAITWGVMLVRTQVGRGHNELHKHRESDSPIELDSSQVGDG